MAAAVSAAMARATDGRCSLGLEPTRGAFGGRKAETITSSTYSASQTGLGPLTLLAELASTLPLAAFVLSNAGGHPSAALQTPIESCIAE